MRPFKILSIDGGGIRGVIPSVWLMDLERRLGGGPLKEHFDMIAGTSTGSILAAALASGMSAYKVLEFYRRYGSMVFPTKWMRIWDRLKRIPTQGFSAPKYSPDGLRKALGLVFGDKKIGDLETFMAITHDTFQRAPMILKSWDESIEDLSVIDVLCASSAAPTYFPAQALTFGSVTHPMIDGGVVANNPAGAALAEAVNIQRTLKKWDGFIIVSLGTGKGSHPVTLSEGRNWGKVQWVNRIFDMFMDSSDLTHYLNRMVLGDANYFRMNCFLDAKYEEMDNAEPENIEGLMLTATAYLSNGGARVVADVVSALKPFMGGKCATNSDLARQERSPESSKRSVPGTFGEGGFDGRSSSKETSIGGRIRETEEEKGKEKG